MITFQDQYKKAQFLSGDNTGATLIQLKQDINIGGLRFDEAINRYFTRKQKFADLVAGQQQYQTPIDAVRVMAITIKITTSFQYPIREIADELKWRKLNIVPYQSTWPEYFFVLGGDQISLWPTPAQSVVSGIRYVYQPLDVDMTKDDYTIGTVTVTNGSNVVTGVGTSFDATFVGRFFEVTDGSDGNWYEVIGYTSPTQLTLKTPVQGTSGSGKAYRIGQAFMFPPTYSDVPVDYALARFFESRNNPQRAAYHQKKYDDAVDLAVGRYASSSTSSVITEDEVSLNLWWVTPVPGP